MVLRASAAAGFDSALNSGELRWTAEFCLPEAILGGADHGIRIMLSPSTLRRQQLFGDLSWS
jgi:hypothetical protein